MNKCKRALSFLTALICAGSVFTGTFVSAADTNDSIDEAVTVDFDTVYSESIESGDTDFFKVTLPESGKLTVNVKSGIRILDYSIYYEDTSKGTILTKENRRNDTTNQINTSYSYDLTAGTYYVTPKVYSSNSEDWGDYEIKFSYTSSEESFAETGTGVNNTLATASAVELNKEYVGQIATNDKIDYYKFNLEESGRITFPFMSDIEETRIKIVQVDNDDALYNKYYSIDSSTEMINKNDYIDLTAGDYYFIVEMYSNNTGTYKFKLDYTSSEESFAETGNGVNNTTLTASEVELNTSYIGQIASNDSIDYYKVTLEESGRITFPINSSMDNMIVRILGNDGVTKIVSDDYYYSDSATGEINEINSIDLIAGTYYFAINKWDYTGNYNIAFNYESSEESFAESGSGINNTTLTASEVELNTGYIGQIATNDSVDYYKVTLEESGRITFPVNSSMSSMVMNILGSDGVTKIVSDKYYYSDSSTGEINKNDSIDLIAGTYYFAVKSSYTGNYTIAFNYESAGESFVENAETNNNVITLASPLEFETVFNGQIASNDSVDYYSFNLVEDNIISWDFSSDMNNVRFYICDSNGKKMNVSNTGIYYADNASGVIHDANEAKLEIGQYYVCVEKYDYTGNYSLSVDVKSPYELGDVNRSGLVDLYDVIEVAKYMIKVVEFDDEQLYLGDMDSNDKVDLYDAIAIAKAIM